VAQGKRKTKPIEDPIQTELDSIKRLLILLLLKAGTPQAEIAKALHDVDPSVVSRMFSGVKIKKFGK